MNSTQSNRSMRGLSRKLATLTLTLLTMIVCCDAAVAGHAIPNSDLQMPDAPHLPQLERAFWACDYVETTRGIHATPADLCGTVTDELRNEKFGGSYPAMIAWWRQNKPAEHEKLARALP